MTQATPNRLPALDGLRAISISLVILAHLSGQKSFPIKSAFVGMGAGFGVRTFFVISGFLITTLLLAEYKRSGTISLRDFYVRRTYRIFPAFYTYLAVIAVVAALGVIQLMDGDLLAATTYTMNYHRPRAWYAGHLWSLSVEEQFYLLWPAVVLLLKPQKAIWVAALAIAAAPMLRVATWILLPSHRLGIGETFPSVFDALAAGCLLAGLRDRLSAAPAYMALMRSPLFALVPLAGIGALLVPRVSFDMAVGITIQNVAIALTIDWAVRQEGTWVARFLELGPIVWIGKLSYSLYLWQQPFVNRTGTFWIQQFPQNLIATFALAIASYYLVEQPFLRLRERRAKRHRVAKPVAGAAR
jgi:peptidoglycan/LPS O-acetylase OafA/YrhL